MNEPQRLRAAEPSAFFITPEEDGKAGEPLVLLSLDTARKPLDFFTKPDMRGAFVQLLAGHVQKLVDQLDPATKAGRDALKSIAYRITRTKTTVDEVGKDEVARLKALPTQVDAGRRELRDALDALAEAVRKPVTEHEARIALADDWLARVAALPERLAHPDGLTGYYVVGLPYVSEVETLDIDFQSSESARDKNKLVSSVNVLCRYVNDGSALWAGPSSEQLNYSITASPQSWSDGVSVFNVVTSAEWSKRGSLILRSTEPGPMDILSVLPVIHVS